MKPNSAVDQSTSSSASRDRCTIAIAAAARNSSAASREPTASMLLRVGPSKPSARAVAARSSGSVLPASAPEPSGQRAMPRGAGRRSAPRRARASRRRRASGARAAPAARAAGACSRAARCRCARGRASTSTRRSSSRPLAHRRGRRRAGRARDRSRPGRCGCGRVWSRPGDRRRSARAAASRCSCGCLRGAGRARACPASSSASIASRPADDRVGVGLRDHAGAAEHARVRDRAADVVARERAVEVDRRGEALDGGVGARLEASAPRFVLGHIGCKSRKAPSLLQAQPPRVRSASRNCLDPAAAVDARRAERVPRGPVATRTRKRRPSRARRRGARASARRGRGGAARKRRRRSARARCARALLVAVGAARVRRRHLRRARAACGSIASCARASKVRCSRFRRASTAAPTMLSAGLDVARVDLRGALPPPRLSRRAARARSARRAACIWEKSRVVVVPARVRASVARRAGAPHRAPAHGLARSTSIRDLDARSRARRRAARARSWSARTSGRTASSASRCDSARCRVISLDAVLAVEDQRFEAHPGIDSVARARRGLGEPDRRARCARAAARSRSSS